VIRVAVFTDNDFGKVNGVTTTLRAVLAHQPADVAVRVYTAADVEADRADYFAVRSVGAGIPWSALAHSGVDARLVVAGDGPSRAAFEAEADRLVPGRIVVLGHVDTRGALARTLASADVFVHANGREPFGIGPLEAMASGVPVVVPESGGVLTYASSANAWLAASTPSGLAEAVTAVVEQPAPARRRARAALETAAGFTWPSATDRLMDLTARIHAACGSHDRRVDLLERVAVMKST
jgi:hypothetical protein